MYSANRGQNNAVGANMFRLKNWYLGNSAVPCETPSIAGDIASACVFGALTIFRPGHFNQLWEPLP